jgi:predicted DNA-binding transcriptional regulator AlpA
MPTVPTVDEAPLLTARNTFDALNMCATTGYKMLNAGTFPIPVRRIGGRWMVNTADLRAYLGLDA